MPNKRKADAFAPLARLTMGLKARRKAVESGNLKGAAKAFRQGQKSKKPVKRK